MLKFLIILFLISYVVYKVGGFLFKSLFVGGQDPTRPFENHNRTRPNDGNVYVDPQRNQTKKDKHFEGGEYVDYEEVKD